MPEASEEDLEELGELVEMTLSLKAANDKHEKEQQYVMPNRRDRRAQKRKKAKR